MSILIVTHAYAVDLPQYASFLEAQIDSLRYRCSVPVDLVVCWAGKDDLIRNVIHRHSDWIHSICLQPHLLFRRAIGRNLVAKSSREELIWFADCDHVFGPDCLNSLWDWYQQSDKTFGMVYPENLMISKDHQTGDAFALRRGIDPLDFVVKSYTRPIGGCQIVRGSLAREFGYLDGTKWQTPTDGKKPFPDFRDDVKYRKFCDLHGGIRRVPIKNLYRIRHSKTTYKG